MTRDQFAALGCGAVVYLARDPIHQDTVIDPDRMVVEFRVTKIYCGNFRRHPSGDAICSDLEAHLVGAVFLTRAEAVGDVRRRVGLAQADLDQALRRLDAMAPPA